MMRTLLILIAALPLLAAAQEQSPLQRDPAGESTSEAQPQQPVWQKLAGELRAAYQAGDMNQVASVLKEMLRYRPYEGELLYRLAAAYAQGGQQSRAYETLILLQKQGLAFDPREDEAFAPVKDTEAFDFIASQLASHTRPFDHADVAFATSESLGWPEGIAHDAESGSFYIGSMLSGRIIRSRPDGKSEVFFQAGQEGPEGFTALAVDRPRGLLWAAGTAVRLEGEQGLQLNMQAARLYRFDLESGKLQASYAIANEKRQLPHLFNQIVVGPDGIVYVSDSLTPLIYKLAKDGEALEAFMGSARLSSLQGLAIDDAGRYLFVADWYTGIYRIHLESREVVRVEASPNFNLGGIHGLSYHEGDLIAIQTGTQPQRVVRFTLSEDAGRIVGQQPLSAAQQQYAKPGLGVLADDGLYFIANSGWGLEGRPVTAEPQRAVVLKADPDLGKELQRNARPQAPVTTGGGHDAPGGVRPQADPEAEAGDGSAEPEEGN